MSISSKLSPAQAVPLLRQAFDTGTAKLDGPQMDNVLLVTWLRHVSLLLAEIEGVSDASLHVIDRALHYWGAGSGENGKAGNREDAFLTAMCVLRTQTVVMMAKAGVPGTLPDIRPAGTKVFVGHGRDPAWLRLQQFLEKRLKLETDDFEGVFPAGKTISERLNEMLDDATFAFLVMTAEDVVTDDEIRARQNVVHEIGLFQGRLGLRRAIILREEGCTMFSNLDGVVYILFPKGNIEAIFEKVRGTLEVAGLVKPLVS